MRKLRIPIFIKLMVVVTLLMGVVSLYTTLETSSYFEKTSIKREEEFNLQQTNLLSWELEHLIQNYVDKIQFYSLYMLQQTDNQQWQEVFQNRIHTDYDLVAIKIIGQQNIVGNQIIKKDILQENELNPYYFDAIEKHLNLPLHEVFDGKIKVKNASQENGIPLLWIGIPIAKNDQNQVINMASAFIKLDRVQQQFKSNSNHLFYLIDEMGTIISHPEQSYTMQRRNLADKDYINNILKDNTRIKQQFINSENDKVLMSYAKSRFGITVVSEVKQTFILGPIQFIKAEAFYILGVVLSLSLLVISFFSNTMTAPIEKLLMYTKEIAKGHFDLPIVENIKTRDEVGGLARAMQEMASGLKDRDKMKNMFDKFHGSTIAEELLSGEVKLSGSKKKVVIFFSDIRSFTKYSEMHTAEEVVSMLNEYMDRMVKVIYKYNGVVDKFVGDAIMAVWGVPNHSENDTHNAVMACIEMRKSLNELNQIRIARGESPIMIGMGLHTGEVISGTVGSEDRMEYTVIGDTVNTAARIEASTKSFGTDFLISDQLRSEIENKFIIEMAGKVEAKGKSEAFKLFKVEGIIHPSGEKEIVRTPYSHYAAEDDAKAKKVA